MDSPPADSGSVPGSPEAASWLPGTRYRLLGDIGLGGSGEVHLARDTVLRRNVALKRVRADRNGDPRRLKQFLSESQRASQINDPRVASLFDVLQTEDEIILVLEYVPGVSLRRYLTGPMALTEFWDIAVQCVEGLEIIHRAGFIHRDLKPENIMITPEGQIKILDLGLALRMAGPASENATTLTLESGSIAGTPPYMAPEALLGAELDTRADIFSLGVVFYEMLTGRRPFAGDRLPEIVEHILHSEPEPANAHRPDVSPALAHIVDRTLAKEPRDRPLSARALLEDLMAARRGEYVVPTIRIVSEPGPEKVRRGIRPRWVFLFLILAGGVGLALDSDLRFKAGRAIGWTPLPEPRRVAVLPITAIGPDKNLSAFGLGLTEVLTEALNRPDLDPGLRVVPIAQVRKRKVDSAPTAAVETGSNLALSTELTLQGSALEADMSLWETSKNRRLDRTKVRGERVEPSRFARRLLDAAALLLHSPIHPTGTAIPEGATSAFWFTVEGNGYLLGAAESSAIHQAIEHFERATHADSHYIPAWVGLGNAYAKLAAAAGDTSGSNSAEAATMTALRIAPDLASTHLARARWLASRGRWDAAIPEFERATELDPWGDDAFNGLAEAYENIGRPDEAERVFEAAAAASPASYQRWWKLAYFCKGNLRLSEAGHAYRKMVEAAPDLYLGYQGLGVVLAFEGQYAEAVAIIEKSLELKSNDSDYSNLATVYFNQRSFDRAIETYQNAIALGYDKYTFWMNLGDAYYCSPAMRDKAEPAYRNGIALGLQAAKEDPADAMVLARLADAYARIGETENARSCLARSEAMAGEEGETYQWLGLAMWQLGRREEALDALAVALRQRVPPHWIVDSAMFDPWRGDPKFQSLVAGEEPQRAAPTPTAQPAGG